MTLTEGNTGSKNATFTVSLSAVSGQSVSVNYATSNVTATADSDYTATSGNLIFAPGETTKTIVVPVLADVLDESNETFNVNLTGVVNATLTTSFGVGTITDDDLMPTLSINAVIVTEGNSGTTIAAFTVKLSAASGQNVTLNYATANGTATAGSDYLAANGSVTFAPGETTKTINVTVIGDTVVEGNETFLLNLSNAVNAVFTDSQGRGTISNDDSSSSALRGPSQSAS